MEMLAAGFVMTIFTMVILWSWLSLESKQKLNYFICNIYGDAASAALGFTFATSTMTLGFGIGMGLSTIFRIFDGMYGHNVLEKDLQGNITWRYIVNEEGEVKLNAHHPKKQGPKITGLQLLRYLITKLGRTIV